MNVRQRRTKQALCDLETAALRKREEAELEVTEMKMLRFPLGETWMGRIRNESIRGTENDLGLKPERPD